MYRAPTAFASVAFAAAAGTRADGDAPAKAVGTRLEAVHEKAVLGSALAARPTPDGPPTPAARDTAPLTSQLDVCLRRSCRFRGKTVIRAPERSFWSVSKTRGG